MLFIHSDNQKLLWNAFQRLPQMSNPEESFKQTIHTIYQNNKDRQLMPAELRELNRNAIFELYEKRPIRTQHIQERHELKMESISDTPITNMEELLQRHLEERDKELAGTRIIIHETIEPSFEIPNILNEEKTIE